MASWRSSPVPLTPSNVPWRYRRPWLPVLSARSRSFLCVYWDLLGDAAHPVFRHGKRSALILLRDSSFGHLSVSRLPPCLAACLCPADAAFPHFDAGGR